MSDEKNKSKNLTENSAIHYDALVIVPLGISGRMAVRFFYQGELVYELLMDGAMGDIFTVTGIEGKLPYKFVN